MGISGLVLTFGRGEPGDPRHDEAREELLARLQADPRVVLGEPVHDDGALRLPFTFEGGGRREHLDFFDEVQDHPATALLTLVFHHYDVDPAPDGAPNAASTAASTAPTDSKQEVPA